MLQLDGNGGNNQTLDVPLPLAMDVTGDSQDDLVFTREDQRWIWHVREKPVSSDEPLEMGYFPVNLQGILAAMIPSMTGSGRSRPVHSM